MDGNKLKIGVCLGAISAIGPLGIDMYLGALPEMARDLGAAMALAQGGFFAYVGGYSFAFIDVHGLTPIAYSLVFCLNVVGLVLGSFAATRLTRRFGFARIAKVASAVFALAALALALLNLGGNSSLWTLCALLFVVVTALGGILPTCTVLAMEAQGKNAGTAAALLGALGYGAGAAATVAMGVFADGGVLPMLAAIGVCGLASALVANTLFPGRVAPSPGGNGGSARSRAA